MKHIVYKMTFKNRRLNNEMPYLYIGSKSNCTFENGTIYDSKGNPYYGSSTWNDYDNIVKNDNIEVEILKESDDYTAILNYESTIQKQLDVVASPLYFNKSIAAVNNFTDPNYATYKHTITEKTVRLSRDHPMVLSGEYVGVSKGSTFSENERKKRGKWGKENPFYGKKHSDKTKQIISKANSGRKQSREQIDNFIEKVAKKPKSKEHREKIGRANRGFVTIKNKNTKECVRIPREQLSDYDLTIWLSPSKIHQKRIKCKYCGIESTVGNINRWHNEKCKHKPK